MDGNGEAQARLDSFLDKFSPEVAALSRALLARLRARLPGATIMVYDNYNALAIGFGAAEKPKQAVLSLAVSARGPSLCFIWGRDLPDPDGLLQGGGNQVRFLRLTSVEMLADARVERLIAEAVARSESPFDPSLEQRLVIRSVSAKQRPRR